MDTVLKRVRIKSETADIGSLADIGHMLESRDTIEINSPSGFFFFFYYNCLFLKFCDLQALLLEY